MFAATIAPKAPSDRIGTHQELQPIIATLQHHPIERFEGGKSSEKAVWLQEMPTWEYFVNELEFE